VRRCGAQVCETLFRTCPAWPKTDLRSLPHAARSAVHQTLREALERRPARRGSNTGGRAVQSPGAGAADVSTRWPVNHIDPARRPGDLAGGAEGWMATAAKSL